MSLAFQISSTPESDFLKIYNVALIPDQNERVLALNNLIQQGICIDLLDSSLIFTDKSGSEYHSFLTPAGQLAAEGHLEEAEFLAEQFRADKSFIAEGAMFNGSYEQSDLLEKFSDNTPELVRAAARRQDRDFCMHVYNQAHKAEQKQLLSEMARGLGQSNPTQEIVDKWSTEKQFKEEVEVGRAAAGQCSSDHPDPIKLIWSAAQAGQLDLAHQLLEEKSEGFSPRESERLERLTSLAKGAAEGGHIKQSFTLITIQGLESEISSIVIRGLGKAGRINAVFEWLNTKLTEFPELFNSSTSKELLRKNLIYLAEGALEAGHFNNKFAVDTFISNLKTLLSRLNDPRFGSEASNNVMFYVKQGEYYQNLVFKAARKKVGRSLQKARVQIDPAIGSSETLELPENPSELIELISDTIKQHNPNPLSRGWKMLSGQEPVFIKKLRKNEAKLKELRKDMEFSVTSPLSESVVPQAVADITNSSSADVGNAHSELSLSERLTRIQNTMPAAEYQTWLAEVLSQKEKELGLDSVIAPSTSPQSGASASTSEVVLLVETPARAVVTVLDRSRVETTRSSEAHTEDEHSVDLRREPSLEEEATREENDESESLLRGAPVAPTGLLRRHLQFPSMAMSAAVNTLTQLSAIFPSRNTQRNTSSSHTASTDKTLTFAG